MASSPLPAAAVRRPASGGDPGVALERRQRRARKGQSGSGGGDRGRRGRLAVGRKKTGHENDRVLAILGTATALSTAALHALSAGHDAPASAVLPLRPRTRKGHLHLATATHVGILSKMAASGGGFFCTYGGGVEGGRSSTGGEGGGTTDGRG
ncbi:hypothetical protein [Oryza sativa Japonica Group]|uniref:Uncharacterized protein n=1 Tax=Oryza sativa subsp. japonica TaxID=39947 RepID=Q5VQG5_ORYSJ|nr:hypothetical protein [Oryza sativa Japonica Group]BAD68320.1 hypothetical protein [Oryza sativa Japonica Group]